MRFDLHNEADLAAVEAAARANGYAPPDLDAERWEAIMADEPPPTGDKADEPPKTERPRTGGKKRPTIQVNPLEAVLTMPDLKTVKVQKAEMLIEEVLPTPGLVLMAAPSKTGKSILSTQIGMAVATGEPLFGRYPICRPGPVLVIAQDDPAGVATVAEIRQKTDIPLKDDTPFFVTGGAGLVLGLELIETLRYEITTRRLVLLVIDSYTSLRPVRKPGDIVKMESSDMQLFDALAKETGCCILLIHHYSKGSAALDWADRGAGSFGIGQAIEGMIHLNRFGELDIGAAERLVRIRGRHLADQEMVIRFHVDTLGFGHVMDGAGSEYYPELERLRTTFKREPFTPKLMTQAAVTNSRQTTHRVIHRLLVGGHIDRVAYGEYVVRGAS